MVGRSPTKLALSAPGKTRNFLIDAGIQDSGIRPDAGLTQHLYTTTKEPPGSRLSADLLHAGGARVPFL